MANPPLDPEARFTDVTQKYAQHLNPGLAKLMAFAGFGIETRAEDCFVWDHEGRRFIDCLGGYGTFTFGHRHPRLVAKLKEEVDQIGLSAKAFFCQPAADLARKLAEITPEGLEYCFFCNSGTEAVEAALKFAKGSTGRSGIVSTLGSYHGKTLGALATTGREKYRKKFEPLMPGVRFVPYGDVAAMVDAIDDTVAAVIIEPIQGEGGIILPPAGYLRAIREASHRHGAVMIADEVQTGLGRTGKPFACEWDGVSPDIMCLAKALGGGLMPIGAIIGRQAIWEKVYEGNPLAHTSTFGGNPLACAVALEAMTILTEDDLSDASRDMGDYMIQEMRGLKERHPDLVGDVRGRGLMIGLEFTEDEVGELVVAQLLKRGVCVAYALNNPRVLRFEPPLTITRELIDEVIQALDESLKETSELLSDLD